MDLAQKKTSGLQNKTLDQRNRGIPTDWLHGMTPEERKDFEQSWRNSTYVLDKLKLIIERTLRGLEIDQEDDYNNPQWPVLRADKNGRAKELKRILKLLP